MSAVRPALGILAHGVAVAPSSTAKRRTGSHASGNGGALGKSNENVATPLGKQYMSAGAPGTRRLQQLKDGTTGMPSTVKRSGLRDITNSQRRPSAGVDGATPAAVKALPLSVLKSTLKTTTSRKPMAVVKPEPAKEAAKDVAHSGDRPDPEMITTTATKSSTTSIAKSIDATTTSASPYEDVEYMPPKELIADPNDDLTRLDYRDAAVEAWLRPGAPDFVHCEDHRARAADIADVDFLDEPVPFVSLSGNVKGDNTLSPFCGETLLVEDLLDALTASCRGDEQELMLDFDNAELELVL